MSLFAPMDPRGPDQRRKQLMAKLAQGRGRGVPMPAQAGHASMGTGAPFRGAGNFRPPSTHGSNVMQSILQRLGVGGAPGQGEFSPGPGQAIGLGGGAGDPYSQAPTPITGGTPIPGGEYTPSPPPGSELPSPDPRTFSPSPAPDDGYIPLGNGLFYDPSTDRVVEGSTPRTGFQAPQNQAQGARNLYRF
jgi:hypothetical protein